MMKKCMILLLALLLLLLPLALADGAGICVQDMYGREIRLAEPATRVVALTAADCEILCALGCEAALVGRGAYCDYPPSIMAVPAVQSGAETNLEEILMLQPQIVFMSDMAQSKDVVDALESCGVKVVVSNADSIEGAYTAIRMIGTLMGRDAEAEAIVADMQSTFADIAVKGAQSGKTVYFEVSPLEWGLWTAGGGTFMQEIGEMCGLENIFADVTGWQPVSAEQVLLRDPDCIISVVGLGDAGVAEIMSRPGWDALTAVKEAQVFSVDPNAISRPGPRLKDAALEIYGLIFGTENE